MANFRGVFPGAFTAGNLICGFLALVSCVNGDLVQAVWLVILAAFLDGLDGFVAKVSRGATRFGVEFDSLADVVSFGAAPALILYAYKIPFLGTRSWLLGAVFLLSAAIRLARYNLIASKEEKESFLGLPVPAAAVSVLSFILFSDAIYGRLRFREFLISLVITYSLLMVSQIRFDARPRAARSTADRLKVLYAVCSVAAVIFWPAYAIFPATLGYIAYGLIREGLTLIGSTKPSSPSNGDSKKSGQGRGP